MCGHTGRCFRAWVLAIACLGLCGGWARQGWAAPAAGEKAAGEKAAAAKPHAPDSDASATNPLMVDPDLAIFTFIVFVLLVFVLGYFAWGPIAKGLHDREHAIAHQIEEARLNAEKSENMLAQYQAQLASAEERVKEMLAAAQREAAAARDKIVADAQALAQRERDRAVAEIQLAKEAALADIAKQHVDSAFALAGRIVRRELKADDHAELVRSSVGRFSKTG